MMSFRDEEASLDDELGPTTSLAPKLDLPRL